MCFVRSGARFSPQIRHLPHLLSNSGALWGDPRRREGELVGQATMSMTDPIADMLARIRNAIMAQKSQAEIPASRLKQHICEVLKDEGFIVDFRRVEGQASAVLQVDLKWKSNQCAIEGLRRVSRPGRRQYVGKEKIPRVRGGQGIAILTTSKGLLSDRNARKQAVGGEVICEVW